VIRKYLEKHNMTITELNEKAGTGHSLFHSLVRDRHRLTSQVALRLGKVFNNDPKFWLDLQTNYDLLTDSQDFKETLEDTIEVLPAALLRSEEYA
jgi:addiction module HigA family antidote